ncbi:RNA-directed DNA polymerase, eukaryota, reverse transcriptase zinc-binding domain protein [Tanacetum coccineum]
MCDMVHNKYSKDRCEEDGATDEIRDSANDVINESCEKGESTNVMDKNDEVLDVTDEVPTLEEALNRIQSTEYDGNLNMNKPMNEKDTKSNNKQGYKNNKLKKERNIEENKESNQNLIFNAIPLSFANIVKVSEISNKLTLIPTAIDEREVIILEDDMVIEGSNKWMISLCGYFFRDEVGMNQLLESGPWMVNNKPLFVQKWNSSINMDKLEPKSLPLWIKLYNVLLIAWTTKGICAIASSLVNAEKVFKRHIEVCYKCEENGNKCSKFMDVEYNCKPLTCDHCQGFRHVDGTCSKQSNGVPMVDNKELRNMDK